MLWFKSPYSHYLNRRNIQSHSNSQKPNDRRPYEIKTQIKTEFELRRTTNKWTKKSIKLVFTQTGFARCLAAEDEKKKTKKKQNRIEE